MRVVKRKLVGKLTRSYGVTMLIVVMFFMIFIGNCIGLLVIEDGIISSDKDGANENTDSSTVASSQESSEQITDRDLTASISDIINDGTENDLIDSVIDKIDEITDSTNDVGSILGEIKDNIVSNLSDNESFSNLLNNTGSEIDELKSDLLNKIETSISNERLVTIEEIESKVEKVFGNVSTGEKRRVLIKSLDEVTGIKEVQFTATRDLTNVKVTIIKLKRKPDNISLSLKKNESVYRYLDIKLTSNEEYVAEDDIENMKFTFKVERTWIVENNIDKETVLLIRFHDGEWQNLSTTLLSENDTHVFFEAETLGCSTFAVVGSTLIEIPEPYVTKTPEIPWTVIIGVITSTTIILVTVLFKARYIYFGEDLHKAGSKEKK